MVPLVALRLMSVEENADYYVDIVDPFLKVCCVKVAPSVKLAHAEVLKKHPALYPFNRSVDKTYSVP